ncbi:MAG TPA: alpha/beta fold hydrolase [bacterium]|mgnify:CR=1 FL=1|nr:alpha/beta fold hydrolase [bacterium]
MRFIPTKVGHLGGEPFFHRRGPVGCLLIHGFTGAPIEMSLVGKYLAERNITVSGIMLAGHGTLPDDMDRTTWRDWVESAERGYEELCGKCEEVFVAGLSMGGALTLYLASRHELPAAVAYAAAAKVIDPRLVLFPLLNRFVRFLPKEDKVDAVAPDAMDYIRCYEYIPMSGIKNIIELTEVVQEGLPRVKCPLLLFQGLKDRTVNPKVAQLIYDSVGSEKKNLIWLQNSGHCVPVDAQREYVWERTFNWIKNATAMPDALKMS